MKFFPVSCSVWSFYLLSISVFERKILPSPPSNRRYAVRCDIVDSVDFSLLLGEVIVLPGFQGLPL